MWRERALAWHEKFDAGRHRIHDLDLEPARYLNLGLASWLLVSAFVWRHSEAQFLMSTFVGSVVAIVAPFEVDSRLARFINLAAGAGLALAAIVLPRASPVVLWHNVILGLLIAGVAFFGPPHGLLRRRPPAPDESYDGVGIM